MASLNLDGRYRETFLLNLINSLDTSSVTCIKYIAHDIAMFASYLSILSGLASRSFSLLQDYFFK